MERSLGCPASSRKRFPSQFVIRLNFMPTPSQREPRRFYRVAYQRLEEAETLNEAGYSRGAVYLAGYTVECILKALILAAVPESQHDDVSAEFRGSRAHSFD